MKRIDKDPDLSKDEQFTQKEAVEAHVSEINQVLEERLKQKEREISQ